MREPRRHPLPVWLGRRTAPTARAALCCALGVLCSAPAAHAQHLIEDGYGSVPLEPGSLLSLWGSQPSAPGRYALALDLDVRSLSVAPGAMEPAFERSGTVSSFGLLGTLGLGRNLDVSAAVSLDRIRLAPAGADASAELPQPPAALGELRLIPRLRLWTAGANSGLALLLPTWLPSGENGLHAARGLRLGPLLAATTGGKLVLATANAGYGLQVTGAGAGVGSNFFTGGIGAEFRLVEACSLLSEVSGRWSPDERSLTQAGGLSSQAHLAARFSSNGWAIQLGAGTGLTGALLEPGWRLLASLSFSSGGGAPESAPTAQVTATSVEPARYSNATPDWQPPDSTKEAAPARDPQQPPDVTSEARPAQKSQQAPNPTSEARRAQEPQQPPSSTPEAPEAAPFDYSQPGLELFHRSPPKVLTTDTSPAWAIVLSKLGSDPDLLIPNAPAGGALKLPLGAAPVTAALDAPLLEIDEVLRFSRNQIRLSPSQIGTLDAVALHFIAQPPDTLLVVEGHSDPTGPPASNQHLSEMRAEGVRSLLIAAGVAKKRISSRGYGSTRPAADDAAGDAAESRRVEFRLVRRQPHSSAAAPSKPAHRE